MNSGKILTVLGLCLGMWLVIHYLLPLIVPFLVAVAVALAAEPLVRLGQKRLKLPRVVASGIGVSAALLTAAVLLLTAGALLLRELGTLAQAVPDLQKTVGAGMLTLQDWMVSTAGKMPEGIRPLVTQTVLNVFDDGSLVMEQVAARIPGAVTQVLSAVPDGLLGFGTAVLASYMLSARLPALRTMASRKLPDTLKQYLPALKRVRKALGGWLLAQGKLALVTWGVVSLGFLLLKVSYAPAWAALIALVDAVPLLGTGIILVPWAVVELLQGQQFRAIVLLGCFAAAAMLRSLLEPRFVGKQLGIDPLVTLLALYVGYRLWGFWGLVAAPLLAAVTKTLTDFKIQPSAQ